MKLKIKLLDNKATIPQRSHQTDAGYDLVAISQNVIDKGNYGYYEYGTGLALDIPVGYAGLIFPRSSISDKGLILSNSVGVIDPAYHGEIKCRFKHVPRTDSYGVGERVAQLVVVKTEDIEFERSDDLGESERGEKGFGSTNVLNVV